MIKHFVGKIIEKWNRLIKTTLFSSMHLFYLCLCTMPLFVDRNFSHGFAVIKKSQYKAITVAYIEAKFSFVTWA